MTSNHGKKMKAAIFLDRDNTLTQDDGYCHKLEDFAWISGADEALRLFHEAGLPIFIVTNQGGIARGFFSLDDMKKFNAHLCEMAKEAGGYITDIAYCPHHPKAPDEDMRNCNCRKPSPQMINALAKKWQIDLSSSIMIGDKASDVEAGRQAGCKSYLFDKTGSLSTLAKQILATEFNL